MTKKIKRLDYLDMAKGIGIILVVIGHSTFAADGLLTWLSSFHMPLFFVISGMLIQYTGEDTREISAVLKRKLFSIMLPYLCFSVIYLLITTVMIWLRPMEHSIVELQTGAIQTVTFYGISVLWFLPALFLGEAVFILVRKKCSHIVTILMGLGAAVLVSAATWLPDDFSFYENIWLQCISYVLTVLCRVLLAYVFLMAGYYAKRYQETRPKGNKTSAFQEVLLAAAFLLLNVTIALQNGRVDMNTLVLQQPVFYFLGALCGSFGVILCCKHCKIWQPLRFLGVNSLLIMLTHLDCRVMITAINLAYWINQYVTRAKSFVLYLCVAVFVTVFELILIAVISRYLPFIIGKKSLKKRNKFKVVKND